MRAIVVFALLAVCLCSCGGANGGRSSGSQNSDDWTLPGTNYAFNRYVEFPDITPQNVASLDARTGAVRWAYGYTPQHVLAYAVNRGVGLANGKVFLGTQDCRVIALDAASGKQLWNVLGCHGSPGGMRFRIPSRAASPLRRAAFVHERCARTDSTRWIRVRGSNSGTATPARRSSIPFRSTA